MCRSKTSCRCKLCTCDRYIYNIYIYIFTHLFVISLQIISIDTCTCLIKTHAIEGGHCRAVYVYIYITCLVHVARCDSCYTATPHDPVREWTHNNSSCIENVMLCSEGIQVSPSQSSGLV